MGHNLSTAEALSFHTERSLATCISMATPLVYLVLNACRQRHHHFRPQRVTMGAIHLRGNCTELGSDFGRTPSTTSGQPSDSQKSSLRSTYIFHVSYGSLVQTVPPLSPLHFVRWRLDLPFLSFSFFLPWLAYYLLSLLLDSRYLRTLSLHHGFLAFLSRSFYRYLRVCTQ
jgi:hypothetical protein